MSKAVYVRRLLGKLGLLPSGVASGGRKETFAHAFGSRYSVVNGVSQEECARLRESVPYVKLYRYNPKHLCPK